jgi:hypothetical protein
MPPPPRPPAGRPPSPPRGNGPAGRPLPGRPAAAPAGRAAAAARAGATARPPSPAQAARAAEEELERRFDRLERRIEQLKVEFYRYFAGDLELPPIPLRGEIEAEMRKLQAMNMRRSVDSFRFAALEARLHSYGEMFGRRLRLLEEGKVQPRHPSRPSAARHDVDAGVVVGPRLEGDAVDALFQGLVARNPRGATMDLDTFRSYLERQVAQIRDKTGCTAVQFRVVNEEGKVKLKAKPVGTAGGGS